MILFLLIGSWVYCVLILVAARKFLVVRPPVSAAGIGVSILKPLSGLDEGLEDNLRSFFIQDYQGPIEILFAVRQQSDAAVPVVRSLQALYPHVASKLLIVGEPPYPNAKVWSLDQMMQQATNDLLIMSDSDIRVDPNLVRVTAAEFESDAQLGVATCPYRAIAGAVSIWSRLEAVGMNTEFFGGVLVARMLEGMHFAVGPTIVARKRCLLEIGGFERLTQYLAEDFMMGKLAADAGWKVILSGYVVEHRIGSESFSQNAAHRVRWARSTRRSRPAGYVGQVFTNPLPIALLLVCADARVWPLVLPLTLLLRALAAYAVSRLVLGARIDWLLLPLQDLLSFVFWIAGFFGNTIEWRGRRYRLHGDGTFTPLKTD